MKIFITSIILILSSTAHGSHREHCEFEIKIENRVYFPANLGPLYDKSYVVMVIEAKELSDSYINCKEYIGKLLVIQELKEENISIGQSIAVEYTLHDDEINGSRQEFRVINK